MILDALKKVWKRLKDKGFEYLKLGLLNQDALENFFGCMRSHSCRFVKLNCYQTDGVFKTFSINNLVSSYAVGSNCLPDYGKGLFALKSLICACETEIEEINEGSVENDEMRHPPRSTKNRKTFFERERNQSRGETLLNSSMDYFERGFIKATSICFRELPLMCFRRELAYNLKNILLRRIDFECITCNNHPDMIADKFLMMISILCISKWCTYLNQLLNGGVMFHGGSLVETRAREHYQTYHSRRIGTNNQ